MLPIFARTVFSISVYSKNKRVFINVRYPNISSLPLLDRNWIIVILYYMDCLNFLLIGYRSLQNCADRLVTGSQKYDHITPSMKQLNASSIKLFLLRIL
jgi:hypothetical protein